MTYVVLIAFHVLHATKAIRMNYFQCAKAIERFISWGAKQNGKARHQLTLADLLAAPYTIKHQENHRAESASAWTSSLIHARLGVWTGFYNIAFNVLVNSGLSK